MRRNIHYKPSKSASILSGVIACAMGVFGLFTIPSIGAMIGFKAIWCLMAFGMGIYNFLLAAGVVKYNGGYEITDETDDGVFLVIDLDLGAGILAGEHLVADLDGHLDFLAVHNTAGANCDDLCHLRLLFCAADKIVFESYGHRDLFQMHSDKRKAYVKPCVSFDLLKRRRVFKCRICRRCKRAARFWEGHNIDRLGIRHGGALANHGAV